MVLLLLSTLLFAAPCAPHSDGQLHPSAAPHFKPGSVELVDTQVIDEIACALSADPTLRVQIEVHSDSQGSGSFNQRVTQARADALRTALVARGLPAERITAVGYGEDYPIAPNRIAEGRRVNRRVEWHTEPPSTRPPPPAPPPPIPPEPPAPPPPAAPLTLCARVQAVQVDSSWVILQPVSEVAAELRACLDGWRWAQDGPDVFATQLEPAANQRRWSLTLRAQPEGSTLKLSQLP